MENNTILPSSNKPLRPFWQVSKEEGFYNAQLKDYGTYYELTCFNIPIYNPDKLEPVEKVERLQSERSEDERQDSIRRTQTKIKDIAFSNDWQYFATITLDQNKIDRYDQEQFKKKLKPFLWNRTQRQGLKYLLIPEHHKDGALHAHALIAGEGLKIADSGNVIVAESNKPIKKETAKKRKYEVLKTVYHWEDWKLGFSSLIPVDGTPQALANYVTKYITKEQAKIFGHRYLAGGQIKREVKKEYLTLDFDKVEGKEYEVFANRKVKYMRIQKEDLK